MVLDKLRDRDEREFYAWRPVAFGWSRAGLTDHITTGFHLRSGEAVTNFPTTRGPESDLIAEIGQDPHNLDLLTLQSGRVEGHFRGRLPHWPSFLLGAGSVV